MRLKAMLAALAAVLVMATAALFAISGLFIKS